MVGIGVSLTGMVPGSALIARWYRERLSSAIGIAFSAAGVGTILFVPFTQFLVGHYDWRFAYRVLASALLVLVPAVAFLVPWKRFYAGHPERAQGAKVASGEGWTLRKAMRTPLYWGLCQVFFFTATAMFTVIVQLVAFFVDVGFSPLTAASAFGALGFIRPWAGTFFEDAPRCVWIRLPSADHHDMPLANEVPWQLDNIA